MAKCINKSLKEFKGLAKDLSLNEHILAAKISLWQDMNNSDNFPSVEQIQNLSRKDLELWKYKESSVNTLADLKDKGIIVDPRKITPGNRDVFDNYHATLLKEVNKAYGLNLAKLFDTEVRVTKPEYGSKFASQTVERIIPIQSAFDAVDNARKELGIFEEKIPFKAFQKSTQFNYTAEQAVQEIKNVSENVYNGEIYPSKEQMERDKREGEQLTLFMPSTSGSYVATNYNSVIDFKEVVLKSVEKRLANAQQKAKTDKSQTLKEEIRGLVALKAKVNKDISALINDPDIFSKTMSIFNKDIAFMKQLIANPTLENLHLAESYIDYFKSISNYSGSNISNTFVVDTTDPSLIDPDIKKKLDELTVAVQNAEGDIVQAKKDYLLDVIGDSDVLKTMFGNDSEEIRDIILAIDKNTKEQTERDLGKFSKYLLSADFSMNTKDLLGQLIVNVLKNKKASNKVEANQYMQAISNLEDKVKTELARLGHGITYFSKLPWLGKHISEVSYDLFYQKTSKGNRTGRLIGKFAHKWFHEVANFMGENSAALDSAIASSDTTKANQALIDKYNWLNERADFVEVQKLPEVINNPAFSMFSQYFNQAEAQAYSDELKARIGEYEYKKLVAQQISYIEDYIFNLTEDMNDLLSDHNVSSPSLLPLDAIHGYNIGARRRNPFEFIVSHNSGQRGKVDYVVGQTGNQYQSLLKYNTFIPKQQIQTYNTLSNQVVTAESGYYDANFSEIEQNPTLLEFWETASEATEWMNNNLNDSNTPLSHNSILRMEKSLTDVLLSKNTGILNKAIFLTKATGKTIKDMFIKPIRNISDQQKVDLQNIKTIQGPVNTRLKTIMMALANSQGTALTNSSTIDLNTLTPQAVDILQKVTEIPLQTLKNTYGDTFPVTTLREILTNQVMEEQTFNLPVMLRAYLDATGTYKAQKEALPMINILKDLYEDIKAEKPEQSRVEKAASSVKKYLGRKDKSNDLSNRRVNAEQRMNHWINKAVKNKGDDDLSDAQYYWAKLGKTYTNEEKMFLKEATDYMATLGQKLQAAEDAITNFDPNNPDPNAKSLTELEEDRDIVQNEMTEIQNVIDNIGHYYALSAAFDTVASRLTIFKGLAWNIKAQLVNRLQGIHSAIIHDTGRFWTQGNIYSGMAFVNRKGLRYIKGMHSYRQEVRKAKLLIEMLGILQDATNELDRAKNNSGLRGLAKKVDPFYLTEYVEWHNQTPMVLAMLMDQSMESDTLIDESGNKVKVPLFNDTKRTIKLQGGGTYTMEYGFPAYNIQDGKLVLKPEFDSKTNSDTWMDFSTDKGVEVYNKIDTTLAVINGDYRKDAAIYGKKTAIGRAVLTFKSWAAMNYHARFAKNTTNLNLGLKDFNGAYTGALATGKTSLAGGIALGAGISVLGTVTTTGLGLFAGPAIATGLIGYGAWKALRHKKNTGEESKAMLQLAAAGQELLRKGIGIPVNLVSGKNIIKAHTFDELNLTPEEKQNLHFIINEIVNLSYIMLIRLLYKSAFGDDEEDEPKTMIDPATGASIPNPNYGKKEKSTLEKGMYYLQENLLTELMQSGTQYINPMTSWDLFTKPASVEGWFKTAKDLGTAGLKTVTTGSTLQSGPYEGKNRLGVAAVKGFLPGIVGEYVLQGDDAEVQPYAFGFGNAMRDDFQKGELIDTWFVSDYKKERARLKDERKSLKKEKVKYWEKEYAPVMEQFKNDPATTDLLQKEVEKLAQQEVEATLPYPNRAFYDENQTKKE